MMTVCNIHIRVYRIQEKETALNARDVFFTENMEKQYHIIEKLKSDLAQEKASHEEKRRQIEVYTYRLSSVVSAHHYRHRSPMSVRALFQAWKLDVREILKDRHHLKLATKWSRKNTLNKYFFTLFKVCHEQRLARSYQDANARTENSVRLLVGNYETDMAKLRGELAEAYDAVSKEQYRRQQLEEDLRRMFLKNMTVMNMEALSLFQHPGSTAGAGAGAEFGQQAAGQAASEAQEKAARQQAFLRQQMKSQQQNLKSNHFELLQQTSALKQINIRQSQTAKQLSQLPHEALAGGGGFSSSQDSIPLPRRGNPPTPTSK
jgi:hypothetical protein